MNIEQEVGALRMSISHPRVHFVYVVVEVFNVCDKIFVAFVVFVSDCLHRRYVQEEKVASTDTIKLVLMSVRHGPEEDLCSPYALQRCPICSKDGIHGYAPVSDDRLHGFVEAEPSDEEGCCRVPLIVRFQV